MSRLQNMQSRLVEFSVLWLAAMAPSLASSEKPDEVDDIVLSMEAPGTNPSAHTHRSLIGLHWLQEPSQIEKAHVSIWQSLSVCSFDMISKHQVELCSHFECIVFIGKHVLGAFSCFSWSWSCFIVLVQSACAQVSSTPVLKTAKHCLMAGQGWDAVCDPVWCNLTRGKWEIKPEAAGGIQQTFSLCPSVSIVWGSLVLMSWHVCFSLPKPVCPMAKFFFSGALAATRGETHQDYGGVVLHVTNAMPDIGSAHHW